MYGSKTYTSKANLIYHFSCLVYYQVWYDKKYLNTPYFTTLALQDVAKCD